MEGPSYLCKTDEVGEICVNSGATGTQYWGLQGLSNSTFKVQPLGTDGKPISDAEYTRSGLLGFLGPGGLVFVCGSRDGLMTVTGRKHNADDIIATVLAVEPMKFIYRGRIAVFSIKVLRDERICVIAEQRPDCSEEEVSATLIKLPLNNLFFAILSSSSSLKRLTTHKLMTAVFLLRTNFKHRIH